MTDVSERKKKALKWADEIVAHVDNDPRSYVKCKESRPITDLKDLLVSSARLFGDKPAYLQKWNKNGEYEPITYNEVLADVNGMGTWMMDKGLKGKKVAVIGPNCYQWCTAYLAVTGGIGCIVPLDRELSTAELKTQINRADVSAIVFGGTYLDTFKGIKVDGDTSLEILINFDSDEEEDGVYAWRQIKEEGKELIAAGNSAYVDAEVDNEEMSVLIFTSGTTGKPKGVMLNQKNLCSELMIAPTIFELKSDDVYLSFLPFHHTYECTCCLLMGIYKGATVAFCQGLTHLTKNLKEVRPTMMLGVPALYEKLHHRIWKNARKQGKEEALKKAIKINNFTKRFHIDLGGRFFKDIRDVFGGRMKTLICGGAKIDPQILDGLREFGFNALQGYGLTEAAPMGAFNPQDAPNSRSIGVPFPGQGIKIIDVNEEGIGEICIKGPNIMMGYYDDPEQTAKVIDEEGWFHTGDLGYVDKDGYAFITGRAKNVIVTRKGKNVYPEEIEYQLNLIAFVEESFVFEDTKIKGDDIQIVAAVKIDEEEMADLLGPDYTEEDARRELQKEVDKINDEAPVYRMIRKVILRKTDFIHNTSAKLMRMAEENKAEE